MNPKKIISLAMSMALCVTAMFGTAFTASAEENSDKTLHLAWTADMQTMDIHKTSSDYEIAINIFDRLFEIKLNDDGSTELVNSLVEDYSVSDDGLVYDFTIRGDVKFSDGTPLTANDVKYTFTRMLALPDSVQTDFADMIAGADEVMDGTSDELSGIEVTDDTHFTITLSEPFAGFLYELSTPSCCIYSESIVEAAGNNFGLDPDVTIGSGPYIITSWEHDKEITLDANPDYWGEQPDVQHVIISIVPDSSTISMLFQNGEIDIIDCDILDSSVVDATYKTAYADNIVTSNRLALTYFMLNENIEPLNDVNVRKAIQMAIDRQSILDYVYSGDGNLEDGIFPTGLIGHTEENQGWLEYDPEGAVALLEESGYVKDNNGYYFSMEIASDESASSSVLLVLQIIQQDLKDVGIKADIVSYDEASWLDLRKSGNMCSFVATWTADYNDPDNFIYTFYGTPDKSAIRSGNYYNTEVMERVGAARSIVDEDERLAEYAALEEQIVKEDAAWVPLFERTHLFVVGDRIESFTPHWAGYSAFSYTGVTFK